MEKRDYDKLAKYVEELERENADYKLKEKAMNEAIAFHSQLSEELEDVIRKTLEAKEAYEKARLDILNMKAEYQQEISFLLREAKEALK